MTETEKMQKLHHRASLGETLSTDESAALQNWYDELDREEEAMFMRTSANNNTIDWRKKYNETLAEIARTTAIIEQTTKQNEVLRRENQRLRELAAEHRTELAL